MEKDLQKEIEEVKKFLESQGEDVAALEKEAEAMKERLKNLDRRVQAGKSRITFVPGVGVE